MELKRARNLVKTGSLIEITGHAVNHVIKLYSDLHDLKNHPFMGFDKVLVVYPEETYVTMVVDTSDFIHASPDLQPMIEAVRILCEENYWWMFSYDIDKVLIV